MKEFVEVEFQNIEENKDYIKLIKTVANTCFTEENLQNCNMYLNVILTDPETIRKANNEFRQIDKETDVLSFPMFEKNEIDEMIEKSKTKAIDIREVLGDIIISIPRIKEQAEEYGHSVERELSYMIVHGFYHVMGYDHMVEDDKKVMRAKEEIILNKLNITRG